MVKQVIRQVSSQNLNNLQKLLIRNHPNVEMILDFINTRPDYAYNRHDYTGYFWFKTGHPSWKELIESLKLSHEDVLAKKIESGEAFNISSDRSELIQGCSQTSTGKCFMSTQVLA